MLAIAWTVELGLDVDARRSGEGEAVADMDVSLRWRRQRRGFRVDGRSIARLHSGMGDLADGLLELRRGQRLGFGQGRVAFEGQRMDGFAARVAGGDLTGRGDLKCGGGNVCGQREGACARCWWRRKNRFRVGVGKVSQEEGHDLLGDGMEVAVAADASDPLQCSCGWDRV